MNALPLFTLTQHLSAGHFPKTDKLITETLYTYMTNLSRKEKAARPVKNAPLILSFAQYQALFSGRHSPLFHLSPSETTYPRLEAVASVLL